MIIGVIGNQSQIEILEKKIEAQVPYTINSYATIADIQSTVDLLFDFEIEQNNDRCALLLEKTNYLFANAVTEILSHDTKSVCRFNGWNTFFERPLLEISDPSSDKRYEKILNQLGIRFIAAPNTPGLLSAKVVAMIINEAYFALEENVSTKNEIDIAMKLGTNYPYGPFEWCEKIGIRHILHLLQVLSLNNELYTPSKKLLEETHL
jgi:3-hydroxybutyryl-CoA dehydrogenase